MADELREWYEPDGDPREALGRQARRLRGGGALYLGGGVGVEATGTVQGQMRIEKYTVTQGEKGTKTFDGPLSAVTHAFTVAGKSSAPDTPGGAQAISDPGVAARLRELDSAERETKADIARYDARLARKTSQGGLSWAGGSPSSVDDGWEARRCEELRARLSTIQTERRKLLSGKAQEVERVPHGSLLEAGTKPEPFSKSKTSNWVAKAGGLPTFIQHVAHDILESKGSIKTTSAAIAAAISQAKKWAAGGNKQAAAAIAQWEKMKARESVTDGGLIAQVELAESRLAVVDETFGDGAVSRLLAQDVTGDAKQLAELCAGDVEVLAFVGDPRATSVLEANARHGQQHRHGDGKWSNVLDRVRKQERANPLVGPDRELRSNTPHPEPEPVAEVLLAAPR